MEPDNMVIDETAVRSAAPAAQFPALAQREKTGTCMHTMLKRFFHLNLNCKKLRALARLLPDARL
jgi:hypothetical protein